MTNQSIDLFAAYRYAPPNVRAVQWNGTLETARALVEFFLHASLSSLRHIITYTVEYEEGYEKVVLKLNNESVYRGNFIVIEEDSTVKVLGTTEFRKTYQPVDQPRYASGGIVSHGGGGSGGSGGGYTGRGEGNPHNAGIGVPAGAGGPRQVPALPKAPQGASGTATPNTLTVELTPEDRTKIAAIINQGATA